MKVSNSQEVSAPSATVWHLLHDPDVLRRAIPGCERFDPLGEPGKYAAALSAGVGPIRGRFSGTVTLRDIHDGTMYAMELDGNGPTGFVRGTGEISLAETNGTTTITVTGDAQVGGVLVQVGSRMIETAVRVLMGQFFAAIAEEARTPGAPS